MKNRFLNPILTPVRPLLVFLCITSSLFGQTSNQEKKINIKKFQAIITNSNYAMAYSIQILLNEKQIKIIGRSGLEGGKDTVLFSQALRPSDTLQQISNININKLRSYYSNPCIEDGSQISVVLKKDSQTKSVHLSNYYQEEIGKIIYLTNSLVPEKYKVWYNKDQLIADYNRCKGIK